MSGLQYIRQIWNKILQTLGRKPPQRSLQASTTAPSPGPDAPRKDQVLHACAVGDIKALDILLDDRDEKPNPYSDRLIAEMIAMAVLSKQLDTLRYLLDSFPDFPENQNMLTLIHNRVFIDRAGLPVYKVLIDRFPFLQDWDL